MGFQECPLTVKDKYVISPRKQISSPRISTYIKIVSVYLRSRYSRDAEMCC